jgi:hypothetical protein
MCEFALFDGLLALVAAPATGPLAAQVGTTTDVLTGIVRDSTGQPVADAIVEATSLETQVVRSTRTDPRGRYTLLFPDGGGQYRLIVRAIGKTPVMPTIARLADEDGGQYDAWHGGDAPDDIVVGAESAAAGTRESPDTGLDRTGNSGGRAARLPLDARPHHSATLAPGVVAVAATPRRQDFQWRGGGRQQQHHARRPEFGGASVSQDAVLRSDHQQLRRGAGQFSGQVATTTRGAPTSRARQTIRSGTKSCPHRRGQHRFARLHPAPDLGRVRRSDCPEPGLLLPLGPGRHYGLQSLCRRRRPDAAARAGAHSATQFSTGANSCRFDRRQHHQPLDRQLVGAGQLDFILSQNQTVSLRATGGSSTADRRAPSRYPRKRHDPPAAG